MIHVKVLVTGSSGFIGSAVCTALRTRGDTVIEMDIKATKMGYIGDIRMPGWVDDRIRENGGVDAVVHCAAILEMNAGIDDPGREIETNITGYVNVLQACVKNNVKRVVNLSSCAVYGETWIHVDESEKKDPVFPYGVTKLAGEAYSGYFGWYHDMNIVDLRLGTVYGPGEWYGRFHTVAIRRACKKQPIFVFNKGNAIRDYIYIDDAVRAITCTLDYTKIRRYPSIFNISGGEANITEVASIISKLTGVSIVNGDPIVLDGRPLLKRNLGCIMLDCSRAGEHMGWFPAVSLKNGLVDLIDWYLSNPTKWGVLPRV